MLRVTNCVIFIFSVCVSNGGGGVHKNSREHTMLLLLFKWSLDNCKYSSLAWEMGICIQVKKNK